MYIIFLLLWLLLLLLNNQSVCFFAYRNLKSYCNETLYGQPKKKKTLIDIVSNLCNGRLTDFH